jgi:hypothetical protein
MLVTAELVVRAYPSAAAHASPMPFNLLPATPSAHMSARGANAGCQSVSRPLPRRRQREPAHRGMTRRRPRPPCLRAACLTAARAHTRPRPHRAAPHLPERLMLVTAELVCARLSCVFITTAVPCAPTLRPRVLYWPQATLRPGAKLNSIPWTFLGITQFTTTQGSRWSRPPPPG